MIKHFYQLSFKASVLFGFILCFVVHGSPVSALAKTAKIYVSPASSNVKTSQEFQVGIYIDGGGQNFNGAQATVTLSPGLSVQSIEPGDCNFTYLVTPSVANPSFAGAALGKVLANCRIYTLNLVATTAGTDKVTLSKASVRSAVDTSEILSSLQGGSYKVTGQTVSATSAPVTSAYELDIKVVDINGLPIPQAQVFVFGNNKASTSANTSSNGVAVFSNLRAGLYTVDVKQNNLTVTKEVSLAGSNPVVNLEMKLEENQKQSPSPEVNNSQTAANPNVGVILGGLIALVTLAIIITIAKSSKRRY